MIIDLACLWCAVGAPVQSEPNIKQKVAGESGPKPEREPPSFEQALAVEVFGVLLPPAGQMRLHFAELGMGIFIKNAESGRTEHQEFARAKLFGPRGALKCLAEKIGWDQSPGAAAGIKRTNGIAALYTTWTPQ